MTTADQITIKFLPDRNFVRGYPKNPATRVAYSDDGRYWEAFADEHKFDEDFINDAVVFFNRTTV